MLKKKVPFQSGDQQRQAFKKLKELLTNYPVLHIYQRVILTELHMEANKHSYCACLMQKSNEYLKLHPLDFFRTRQQRKICFL